jgi:hypothetical protein
MYVKCHNKATFELPGHLSRKPKSKLYFGANYFLWPAFPFFTESTKDLAGLKAGI